ncbi:BON domain-containing protein [Roseiconus lacunae]|uniref:BON domain-containing protein n=1 Tax=Roseiconus lacunae TaxID=2605694 RepID=A0ABT7PL93_9BACT|nr:BON domain-containing protein [Roseiconus lacunae]MCD0460965.1 BON domain-containing protein [Roseiconus lacunae]MDM4017279.1 BON domain-containing protein [Roseiconus lacunae]WRQ48806.1 BON domain-containing protein [Stieleria sp. HD01]
METTDTKNLAVAASQVLASSSVPELRTLRVDEQCDELQLHGSVRSFYHKQLAQEAVFPIACGKQVVNYVDVQN